MSRRPATRPSITDLAVDVLRSLYLWRPDQPSAYRVALRHRILGCRPPGPCPSGPSRTCSSGCVWRSTESRINTVFMGFVEVQTCAGLSRNTPMEQVGLAVRLAVHGPRKEKRRRRKEETAGSTRCVRCRRDWRRGKRDSGVCRRNAGLSVEIVNTVLTKTSAERRKNVAQPTTRCRVRWGCADRRRERDIYSGPRMSRGPMVPEPSAPAPPLAPIWAYSSRSSLGGSRMIFHLFLPPGRRPK